jgi:hypothetical protein
MRVAAPAESASSALAGRGDPSPTGVRLGRGRRRRPARLGILAPAQVRTPMIKRLRM